MNLEPGGKQAILRDGFIHAKQCPQSMVFPENYPDATLRGKAKGIRQVLIERELWRPGMKLDCKPTCSDSTSQKCCARQCLRLGRDFQAQKGSLQDGMKHVVIWFSFVQSSIVSSILLSSFGLLQNDMHDRIVSTHNKACGIQFLYHWTLYLR